MVEPDRATLPHSMMDLTFTQYATVRAFLLNFGLERSNEKSKGSVSFNYYNGELVGEGKVRMMMMIKFIVRYTHDQVRVQCYSEIANFCDTLKGRRALIWCM